MLVAAPCAATAAAAATAVAVVAALLFGAAGIPTTVQKGTAVVCFGLVVLVLDLVQNVDDGLAGALEVPARVRQVEAVVDARRHEAAEHPGGRDELAGYDHVWPSGLEFVGKQVAVVQERGFEPVERGDAWRLEAGLAQLVNGEHDLLTVAVRLGGNFVAQADHVTQHADARVLVVLEQLTSSAGVRDSARDGARELPLHRCEHGEVDTVLGDSAAVAAVTDDCGLGLDVPSVFSNFERVLERAGDESSLYDAVDVVVGIAAADGSVDDGALFNECDIPRILIREPFEEPLDVRR